MSGLFSNLTSEGLEEAQDRLGGYQPLDTDVYDADIKVAYAGKSSGGAHSVTFIADAGGREYRETFWITNKQGQNYFEAKDKDGKLTGKKQALPGFTVVDDICLIATGSPLSDQPTEEKVVKIYDPESRSEKPTGVPVLVDLVGKKVKLGIIRATENQTEKDNSGNYVPKADGSTRDVNFVDKVFHPEQLMTVVEAKNGAEKATFHDSWIEKNRGITRDRTVKNGAKSGRPNTPPTQGQQTERKSLFGNKS